MSTQTPSGDTLDALMENLGNKDGMLRQRSRLSLVAMGAAAVPPLILALQNSTADQVRWEAAKALGDIGDARAIPALVQALEDEDSDVVWLAAEGLNAFGMAAWPTLLKALINEGTESVILRQGAHHVLHDQKQKGYDDLLAILISALDLDELPDSASRAASDILNRMREIP